MPLDRHRVVGIDPEVDGCERGERARDADGTLRPSRRQVRSHKCTADHGAGRRDFLRQPRV